MPANTDDFFGEGTAAAPAAPDEEIGPDGLTKTQRAALLLRQNQTNNVAGAAYKKFGSVETPADILGTTKDGSGNTVQIIRGTPQGDAAYNAKLGTVTDLGFAGGVKQLGFSPNYGADTLGAAGSAPIVDRSLQKGDQLADTVLGTQPTVSPQNQVNVANRDALTPVVDPNLATSPETDRALALSEDLVNRITNAPLQTQALGDQALSSQLAIARSARGGAGAVQDALGAAQQQAPQLQAQTAQQSIQEQVARAGAAGQAASIYAGVATNDANRAATIATANQTAAMGVLQNLTTLTGQDLQFDAAKMGAIGQLARDYFNNAQVFSNMDNVKQIAQWQDLTQRYGIDHNFKAAIEKISADEGIGPLDAFKMALGAASALPGLAAL